MHLFVSSIRRKTKNHILLFFFVKKKHEKTWIPIKCKKRFYEAQLDFRWSIFGTQNPSWAKKRNVTISPREEVLNFHLFIVKNTFLNQIGPPCLRGNEYQTIFTEQQYHSYTIGRITQKYEIYHHNRLKYTDFQTFADVYVQYIYFTYFF